MMNTQELLAILGILWDPKLTLTRGSQTLQFQGLPLTLTVHMEPNGLDLLGPFCICTLSELRGDLEIVKFGNH